MVQSMSAGMEWPIPANVEWPILAGMNCPIPALMEWTISFWSEWNEPFNSGLFHSVDANKNYASQYYKINQGPLLNFHGPPNWAWNGPWKADFRGKGLQGPDKVPIVQLF